MASTRQNINISNRKAFFDYEIQEKFEAGIVLVGTEVKALREGRASFKDSYARVINGELWLVNMHISPYANGGYSNHEPMRMRKLLLHKREIKKLYNKSEEQGLTIVPLKLYFKDGRAKVEIAVARGKKLHDKRQSIADKDMNRDAQRELKNSYRLKF
ncbi:MAG TPA: SsrA-binding protein SmpB [bacterium]|nr:SsrA-binding protein SmpB [bacterium]HPN45883.1 SsrA-binding protein SmpB [bacterium]